MLTRLYVTDCKHLKYTLIIIFRKFNWTDVRHHSDQYNLLWVTINKYKNNNMWVARTKTNNNMFLQFALKIQLLPIPMLLPTSFSSKSRGVLYMVTFIHQVIADWSNLSNCFCFIGLYIYFKHLSGDFKKKPISP